MSSLLSLSVRPAIFARASPLVACKIDFSVCLCCLFTRWETIYTILAVNRAKSAKTGLTHVARMCRGACCSGYTKSRSVIDVSCSLVLGLAGSYLICAANGRWQKYSGCTFDTGTQHRLLCPSKAHIIFSMTTSNHEDYLEVARTCVERCSGKHKSQDSKGERPHDVERQVVQPIC
jgi:hypothetical protein